MLQDVVEFQRILWDLVSVKLIFPQLWKDDEEGPALKTWKEGLWISLTWWQCLHYRLEELSLDLQSHVNVWQKHLSITSVLGNPWSVLAIQSSQEVHSRFSWRPCLGEEKEKLLQSNWRRHPVLTSGSYTYLHTCVHTYMWEMTNLNSCNLRRVFVR